jgi:hypothetical protein
MRLEEYTCITQATFTESAFHKARHACCWHFLPYDTKMVKNVEETKQ